MRNASLSPDFSTRCRNNCAKLSARSGLALVLAIGLPSALSDIVVYACRPAAPSFAALAIVMDLFMPTRCAQLRCACDRHGLILLGVPTVRWPKRKFATTGSRETSNADRQRRERHPAVCGLSHQAQVLEGGDIFVDQSRRQVWNVLVC